MFSYSFYKIMHFVGIFMVFSGLGGQCLHALNSGDKDHKGKKWLGIMHGVGLLLALVAGFGLLARLGVGLKSWVIVKLAIWVILGGVGAIASRKKNLAGMLWAFILLLGWSAAYMAVKKPF